MSKLLETLMGQKIGTPYIMTMEHLLLSILFSVAAAGFMLIIYRACHDTLTYRKKFGVTLMMLSVVSTVLLALIQNNPLLSLGVLGSLSICRVRTNTRDPRDLGFVFWALAIGIASAVGAFAVGIIGSLVTGMVLIVLQLFDRTPNHQMIVVRGQKPQLEEVQQILHQVGKGTVQSKNVFADSFELVYELQIPEQEEEQLLVCISSIDGVDGVNILAPETKVA